MPKYGRRDGERDMDGEGMAMEIIRRIMRSRARARVKMRREERKGKAKKRKEWNGCTLVWEEYYNGKEWDENRMRKLLVRSFEDGLKVEGQRNGRTEMATRSDWNIPVSFTKGLED